MADKPVFGLNLKDTYFVSTKGSDNNSGNTSATAWRTLSYAGKQVEAGDTLYVEKGNYGKDILKIINPGNQNKPIIIIGYDKYPGDNPSTIKNMPSIKDVGDYSAISLNSYCEVHNFHVDNAIYGGSIGGKHHTKFSNCYIENCVYGFFITGNGSENSSTYNTIENCKVIDSTARGINIFAHADFTNVTDCYIESAGETDYYVKIEYSNFCLIDSCEIKNTNPEKHAGHGYQIKDDSNTEKWTHSHGNVIINCISSEMQEAFSCRHECYNNQFINCIQLESYSGIKRATVGIVCGNGAHDNIFRNIKLTGSYTGIAQGWTPSEGRAYGPFNNIFENIIIQDVKIAVGLKESYNNILKNAVVYNSSNLFFLNYDYNKSFLVRNIIVCSVSRLVGKEIHNIDGKNTDPKAKIQISYSCFFNNDFNLPNGTGNIVSNPLFADPKIGDFHVRSKNGRYTEKRWVKDQKTSPCIDAGNPNDLYYNESQPNGGRINIGAYGGTPEASKSA